LESERAFQAKRLIKMPRIIPMKICIMLWITAGKLWIMPV
jgi:hypothetical protein